MKEGLLLILFLGMALIILSIIVKFRKRTFNSINVGDVIHYISVSLCDGVDEVYDFDRVEKIEYYENGEIKFIYTSKGNRFNFLNFFNYFRDP